MITMCEESLMQEFERLTDALKQARERPGAGSARRTIAR